MWHADLYTMKEPRMKGLNLITYLDDFHMCVTSTALLKEAPHQNTVIALWQVIGMFDVPVAILSDNGLCFVGRGNCKKKTGTWTLTLFVKALDERDKQKTLEVMIDHIVYQVQFTMNLTNEAGTPKHIDDIKLKVMKKQLFGFFGNFSE